MIERFIEKSGAACIGGFIAYYNDMSLYAPDPAVMLSRAVAILVRAEDIHRIVEMNRLETVNPDNPVKLRKHTVKVVHYVVATVPDVTGVKANSKSVASHWELRLGSVDDCTDLGKIPADLAALSRHSLEEYCRGRKFTAMRIEPTKEDAHEHSRYEVDPLFGTLPDMAAGMKVVHRARSMFKAIQVVCHYLLGKLPDARLGTCRV